MILRFAEEGIRVARVPSYSPSSIAEYAISSMMALAKNLQMSYEQTKHADFTIGGLQCILMEDKAVSQSPLTSIGCLTKYVIPVSQHKLL